MAIVHKTVGAIRWVMGKLSCIHEMVYRLRVRCTRGNQQRGAQRHTPVGESWGRKETGGYPGSKGRPNETDIKTLTQLLVSCQWARCFVGVTDI